MEGEYRNTGDQSLCIVEGIIKSSSWWSATSIEMRSYSCSYLPIVGQVFGSYDLAASMYYSYATSMGFSVRKDIIKVVDGC